MVQRRSSYLLNGKSFLVQAYEPFLSISYYLQLMKPCNMNFIKVLSTDNYTTPIFDTWSSYFAEANYALLLHAQHFIISWHFTPCNRPGKLAAPLFKSIGEDAFPAPSPVHRRGRPTSRNSEDGLRQPSETSIAKWYLAIADKIYITEDLWGSCKLSLK